MCFSIVPFHICGFTLHLLFWMLCFVWYYLSCWGFQKTLLTTHRSTSNRYSPPFHRKMKSSLRFFSCQPNNLKLGLFSMSRSNSRDTLKSYVWPHLIWNIFVFFSFFLLKKSSECHKKSLPRYYHFQQKCHIFDVYFLSFSNSLQTIFCHEY